MILLVAALAAGYYLLLAHLYFPGLYQDDVIYVGLARALATGQGYHEIWMLGAPPHQRFPPLYPLLLTPFQAFAPDNLHVLRGLSFLFDVTNAVLIWRLLQDLPTPRRVLVSLLAVTNLAWAQEATAIMTEPAFTTVLLAYLLLLRRWTPDEDADVLDRLVPRLALLAVVAVNLRSIGVALPLATAWMVRRRPGLAARYLGLWALVEGPLWLLQSHADYVSQAARLSPVADLVSLYLQRLPADLLGGWDLAWASRSGLPPAPWIATVLGLAVWAVLLRGLKQPLPRGVRPLVGCWYLLLLFWPYTQVRFSVPVIPLLYAMLAAGLSALLPRRADAVLAGLAVLQVGLGLLVRWPATVGVPRQTLAWIAAHPAADPGIVSNDASTWLYTSQPIDPIPLTATTAPPLRAAVYLRRDGYVLIRPDSQGNPPPPAYTALLDSQPQTFKRVYDNAAEHAAVYAVVGDAAGWRRAWKAFELGKEALREGHGADAAQLLQEALKVDPDLPGGQQALLEALRLKLTH